MASPSSPRSPADERLTKHRSLYKGKTPPWKDTYRRRCFDRLRTKRGNLLDKLRRIEPTCEKPQSSGNLSCVGDVMEEEWKILQGEHNLPSMRKNVPNVLPDVTDGIDNFDEIFSVMEEIKAELLREEQDLLAQYNSSVKFDEDSLCAAVEQLDTDELICPVCRRNPLLQNKSVIFCACGIRIDTEQDCLTLSHVKIQLSDAVKQHGSSCIGESIFSVVDQFGSKNLLMSCKSCDYMYIIL
ncbi:RPA-interacting protein A-like [Ptychodera flava]|uniref:RPA-interacting protein A-like n=1 Tax=Ptychodera flava TaxID=63121 RepID=UPI00396AA7ED